MPTHHSVSHKTLTDTGRVRFLAQLNPILLLIGFSFAPLPGFATQDFCPASAAYDTVELDKRWVDAGGEELSFPPNLSSTITLSLKASKSELRVIFPSGDTGNPIISSSVQKPDKAGSAWPDAISATFINDTRVTANSTKDLSNVVLLFADCSRQKFEDLKGYSGTFSGTGEHAGKTIIGVWIKSGSNKSGDGPGFGEYVGRALKLEAGTPFTVEESGLPSGWVSQSGLGTFVSEPGPSVHTVVNQAVLSISPSISLLKTVGATPAGDIYTMAGPHVLTYHYLVENTGNTWLSDVSLDDDKLGEIGFVSGPLAPAETAVFSVDALIEAGVTNLATVVAKPCQKNGAAIPGQPLVSDIDDAVVHVLPAIDHPCLFIEKEWYDAETNLLAASPARSAPVSITASNAWAWVTVSFPAGSGSDPAIASTCLRPADESDSWPAWVRAEFSSTRLSVDASSSKTLSNVVLKFDDGAQQKFDGLTAFTQTFGGTGEHAGKAIEGLWIKSGSNASGDGPGFGSYFAPALMIGPGEDFVVTETGLSNGWTAFEGLGWFVFDGASSLHTVKNVMPQAPEPGIRLVKTAADAPNDTVLTLDEAGSVTYTYTIENTGNTWLGTLSVIDDTLGPVGTFAGPLAPSASTSLQKTVVITETVTNLAFVSATPCTSSGDSLGLDPVVDEDDAIVRMRPRGTIGNWVWLDANANGIQDTAESGLAGVVVALCDAEGFELASQETNGEGYYTFDNLLPGTYCIRFDAPGGFVLSASLEGDAVAIDSTPSPETGFTDLIVLLEGGTDETIDAGMWLPEGALSLIKTAGEAPDGETLVRVGPGSVVYTYTIQNTGNTWLKNVVVVDDKIGLIGTINGLLAPGSVTNLSTEAEIDESVINIGTVRASPATPQGGLVPGATDVSDSDDASVEIQPAGLAAIGDTIWVDANTNGVQDARELGLGGVTIVLENGAGTVIDTTVSASDGGFLFDNLPAGTYQLQFIPPSDVWQFTSVQQGGNFDLDSDADPETGRTSSFSLAHGQQDLSRDAGLFGDIPPGFCSEMTIGENFNALILGDFSASGGDTEGRLAVGGTAVFNTAIGYSVGISIYGEAIPGNLTGVEDMLIVRGDLHDGIFAVNGNIVYGGTRHGPERYDNPSRRVDPLTFKNDGNVSNDGSGDTFETLFERIRLASAMIATLADRGVVEIELDRSDFAIHFVGDDPTLNVFNVSASAWNGAQVDIHVTAPEYSTVVLNVHGPVIALTNAAIRLTGITNDRILFNYPNATTLSTGGFSHEGAVLAPDADALLSGGYFEGFGVFGGNVATTNGFEFHHFPFRGKVCTEAEIHASIDLQTLAGNAADGDVLTVLGGASVQVSYRITNTGNTLLNAVNVEDHDRGSIGTLSTPLAPGQTVVLTATLPSVATDTTVLATATGRPVRADGTIHNSLDLVSNSDTAIIEIGSPGASGGTSASESWLRPDFALTAIDLLSQPTLTGEVFTVRITIDNHGELAADAGRLSVYLDEPGPVPIGTPGAAQQNAGVLFPGESRSFDFTLQADGRAGTRHLRAFIDSLGQVEEWSDGDNQLSTVYTLNPIALQIEGTDTGMALSWNSFWGQRYTLYRCTDLGRGFLLYKSNLQATPPFNRHIDAEDHPVRFYRLVVEQQ